MLSEAEDPGWREGACYQSRFQNNAVLDFSPSGIRLELEQSGGDGVGYDFDQATVWPAGVVLARALQHPAVFAPGALSGKNVLELGSGCGVAGLMAAAMGAAHVALTDLPAVLPVLKRNAERSAAAVAAVAADGSAMELDVWALEWDDADEEAASARAGAPDIILGADVTTFVQLLPALAHTVRYLASPATDVYIAHHARGDDSHFFQEEFVAHGFEVRSVPLPEDVRAGRCAVYHLRLRSAEAVGDAEGGQELDVEAAFESRLEALVERGDHRAIKALLREREAQEALSTA
jgi:predicted nicotinamide N-methyase